MPKPTFPAIIEQFHAYRTASDTVVTVQRWTGFRGGRHAYVLITGDAVTTQRAGSPGHVLDTYRSVTATLAADLVLTEDQARDRLEHAGLSRQRQCRSCDEKLPIGGLYCLICGLNQIITAQ